MAELAVHPELLIIAAGVFGSLVRLFIVWAEKKVPFTAFTVIYHIVVGFASGYLVFLIFTPQLYGQPYWELQLELLAFIAGYLGSKFIKKIVEGRQREGKGEAGGGACSAGVGASSSCRWLHGDTVLHHPWGKLHPAHNTTAIHAGSNPPCNMVCSPTVG